MKKSNFQVLMTYQSLTSKYVLKHNIKARYFQVDCFCNSFKISTKLDREVSCWKIYSTETFGKTNETLTSLQIAKYQTEAVKFFKALAGLHMEGVVIGYENKVAYEANKLEAIQAITQSN